MAPLADLKRKRYRFPKPEWDKPSGRLRHVLVRNRERHAIYVVEYPEGWKRVRFIDHTHRVFFPWHYFFVKVRWLEVPLIPSDAGAYIFFAERRARDLDDKVLLRPYLPNLFTEAGICMDHKRLYSRSTPRGTIADMIRWFYRSRGNAFFESYVPEGVLDFGFKQWSKMSEDEARKIHWEKARYRSIAEAAENLTFKYWERRPPYMKPEF